MHAGAELPPNLPQLRFTENLPLCNFFLSAGKYVGTRRLEMTTGHICSLHRLEHDMRVLGPGLLLAYLVCLVPFLQGQCHKLQPLQNQWTRFYLSSS